MANALTTLFSWFRTGNHQDFGNVPTPVGDADRSLVGELLNPNAISAEDWARQQQADMLAFERNAGLTREQNVLDRDLTRELAQNSYQWAVQDMKKSGINPVMALGAAGGANPVAQSSSYGTPGTGAGGQGTSNAGPSLLGFIGKIASGLISGDNQLSAIEFAQALRDESAER